MPQSTSHTAKHLRGILGHDVAVARHETFAARLRELLQVLLEGIVVGDEKYLCDLRYARPPVEPSRRKTSPSTPPACGTLKKMSPGKQSVPPTCTAASPRVPRSAKAQKRSVAGSASRPPSIGT